MLHYKLGVKLVLVASDFSCLWRLFHRDPQSKYWGRHLVLYLHSYLVSKVYVSRAGLEFSASFVSSTSVTISRPDNVVLPLPMLFWTTGGGRVLFNNGLFCPLSILRLSLGWHCWYCLGDGCVHVTIATTKYVYLDDPSGRSTICDEFAFLPWKGTQKLHTFRETHWKRLYRKR